ncbi:MAG: translocation/assembly module TamB domain-containing protein [Gammaproteobacteria bacterium]|nr:translocation/assembly module TamB domain-containing protein [Gammaproteobacteria bacterium]
MTRGTLLRRSLLALAALLIPALILGPLLLVWAALYTESGLRFVVRHIPAQLGGVHLVITGVHGSAARGLHVERVAIEHQLVRLTFEDIDGSVQIAPLLLQTIRSPHTRVGRAWIEVKKRTQPPTPSPPIFLPRWLLIIAEDARVDQATLSVYTGFRMQLRAVHGAAVLRTHTLRFFQAEGTWDTAQLRGIGTLIAADPLGMEVEGHIDWRLPGQPAWIVDGSARGNLNRLEVRGEALSPLSAAVSGELLDLTEHFHWAARATLQDFTLTPWGVSAPLLGHIRGEVQGSGDADTFRAAGPLESSGLRAGTFAVSFEGRYAARVLYAQRMEARHLGSGASARASGTFTFTDPGPRLALSGSWSDFRWPLPSRDPALRSRTGRFTLEGVLPYRVTYQGELQAATLPVMSADLAGTLGADGVTAERAEVDLLKGHASVHGGLTWSPTDSWQLSGRASGIDPSVLRADLPGSLNFLINASGRGFEPTSPLTASFGELSGRLRGLKAGGSGTLSHSGEDWGFSAVRVSVGGTTLALDGHVSERLDLRFALSTQDLSLLAPDAAGTLRAAGTVHGTFAEPALVATAHGGGIDYAGVKIKNVDADVDFDPAEAQKASKVAVHVQGVAVRNRTLDSASFTLGGLPADYTARLTLSAPGINGTIQAHGAYAHERFRGQLTALSLAGNDALRLTLERPVGLLLDPAHLRVEWLCLSGSPASVCADGEWTPAAWSSTVMTNELPLATLTAGMTPSVQYLGTINALARLAGDASTPLQGTLRAELADAEIAHRLASRKIEHTRIGSGAASVIATASDIQARASLGDGEVGTLQARLDLQRSAARWQDYPLSGELHAQSAELGLVSLYVPDIDRASGHFSADAQLAGTLAAPRLAGLLRVSDGAIDVYQVNLALRQLAAEARLSDAGLDFKGDAHVGAGAVSAGGHLEWHELKSYGKFHLQGSNLRVADIPEAQIDASPDLDFVVQGRRIEVTGKVLVPYARIVPKDITNAVRASDDEVIVGSEEEDPAKRLEVHSDITLSLGDKVTLDTLGLTGRLTGSIEIRSGYDAITRATGDLSIQEGQYLAYARKLDIQRGRLVFNGGPIDNPGVELVAVKVFPDVTAGVNVRGTLLSPHMFFFSNPPLPQAQIVSLILAGGSLETAQNRSAYGVAAAQGAALLAQQLGSRIGIQDVSLESDISNETSLVIGRYLSPRLYVSYGISLTQQLNTFKLRYTLGDHWTVKAEVGQAQGADLVYTISK